MTVSNLTPGSAGASPRQRTILVVDDDQIFRTRLIRALQTRGYEVVGAASGAEGIDMARRHRPGKAVVDLRMPGMNGLDLVSELSRIDPDMQILVLTGYGSIATAVEAVRRGALDYLTKPADTEQILSRFEHDGPLPAATGTAVEVTPSLARVEWEHIQRTLEDCDGNISQAARKLGIHRRSLQRKLGKLPPLE
jgi:two-component system response regulator RegA